MPACGREPPNAGIRECRPNRRSLWSRSCRSQSKVRRDRFAGKMDTIEITNTADLDFVPQDQQFWLGLRDLLSGFPVLAGGYAVVHIDHLKICPSVQFPNFRAIVIRQNPTVPRCSQQSCQLFVIGSRETALVKLITLIVVGRIEVYHTRTTVILDNLPKIEAGAGCVACITNNETLVQGIDSRTQSIRVPPRPYRCR